MDMEVIGKSVVRKEAQDKVTGQAQYTHDYHIPKKLYGRLVISPYAHARIVSIDTKDAMQVTGVRAILTGENLPLTGESMQDRPPLAVSKVRYHGEAVVLVVADTPFQGDLAVGLIKIQYELLPVIHTPTQAFQNNSPLVHERLGDYNREKDVYPVPETNIAHHVKIRKGDMEKGWRESFTTVEAKYSLAPSDHVAMETRSSTAEITADGSIKIVTSSQSPFMVKQLIAQYFNEDIGKIVVETPLVGGAYGGRLPSNWKSWHI